MDLSPTPTRFRALARSSPWRWRTVRFTVSWRGDSGREPVRAWVRRPGRQRVETLDGRLLVAETTDPPVTMVQLSTDGTSGPVAVPWASEVAPVLDADGLVAERPDRWQRPYSDPMFENYRWIAMLDPLELAVGSPDETGDPVVVDEVRAVSHAGRPAWEAVLRPRPAYDPTCSCCALLLSAESERWEADDSGIGPARRQDPTLEYADAHRVRLDLGTGICVLTEEIGGTRAGSGHTLHLDAVDEPMPDDLFHPDAPGGRGGGWTKRGRR